MINSTDAPPYIPAPLLVSSSLLTSAQLVTQFEDFRNNLRFVTTAPELVFERLVGNINEAFNTTLETERQQHASDLKKAELPNEELHKEIAELNRKIQDLLEASRGCKCPRTDIRDKTSTPAPTPTVRAVRIKCNPRIGSFHTSEARYWFRIIAQTTRIIAFGRPYQAPPGLPLGLTSLDIGPLAKLHVKSYTSNIHNDRFEMHIDAREDMSLRSAGCSWLEIEAGDPDFQSGSYSTLDDHMPDKCPMHVTRGIKFERAYETPPVVVVWLTGFDMNQERNCRIKTYAEGVTATGFTLHTTTWGDSVLYSADSSWVAYTAGIPGVYSGHFSTLELRTSDSTQMKNSGYHAFQKGFFSAPPRTMIAINSVDIDHKWGLTGLKIIASASSVSEEGIKWNLDAWMGATIYSAGASYIAMS